jgi:uncharacterized protein YceH (UPF0502 family)
MAVKLSAVELRVLGVLIEKSLSQPAYYPMTLNAVTTASNQKSNRDPVMQLTEGDVGAALHQLRQWQLADQAPPDRGSRANRFRHEVEQRFGWNAAQRAIMAELMLRGPQTIGELRARASRMTHLESTEYIHELLEELSRSDPPMVVELSRQPGKTTTRWAHLLTGEAPAQIAEAAGTDTTPSIAAGADPTAPSIEARLNALEQEVIAIKLDLNILRGEPRN